MTQQVQQTVYPRNQQPRGVQIRPATIRTCVSRRPAWVGALIQQLVFLIRDASSSMSGRKAKEATRASQDLVVELANPVNKDAFYCGVIDFDDTAQIVHPTIKATDLVGHVNPIRIGGMTNIHHSLELAKQMIDDHQGNQQERWQSPVLVLYSDGEYNAGGDPIPAADQLKQMGAVIVTVAYGDDADIDTLGAIATSPQHCYSRSASGSGGELRKFMASVGRTLTMTMTTGGNASQTLGTL